MNAQLQLPIRGWSRAEESSKHGSGGRTIPRIGLVLSSGGARGLAHAGVIQVLEEEGIPIAAVAGCSMGAYVGSLWTSGLNGAQLEERAREIKDRATLKSLMDFIIPPSQGLIRGEKLRRHLERDLGSKTFAELEKPLIVIATDLDRLTPHVFDSGIVSHAVHASSAIPAVCAPVTLDGRRYTDGGASEPLPVTLLKKRIPLDRVIAVNVMPTPDDFEANSDRTFMSGDKPAFQVFSRMFRSFWQKVNLLAYGNVLDTFRRALMAAQLHLIAKEEAAADVVIHPRFAASTWHDFENFGQYLQAGRDAASDALPAIRALLQTETNLNQETISHELSPQNSRLGLHAA
ncbi:patatin-like phospholipase family protein [Prosthecobacter sp.]|uniref:patatin-like phospholipase family protein n=1 Tax=Prosthecobacter sp. TaxID=1965333 RepID=UPI001D61D507|nr:patatin-like phospholipase family protein [Prosthecobacter sp.]MCB1275336.1 patatin-like phospholipase family protein [Prosthecobacter sp.]